MSRTVLETALAVLLPVFGPNAAPAQEPAERAAAERLVAAVNDSRSANDPKAFEALLSKDLAPNERAAIIAFEQAICAEARRPMSELAVPHLSIRAFRLITPEVAEVDAVNVQIGSMPVMRNGTVVLILRKDGSSWRIALVRSLGLAVVL